MMVLVMTLAVVAALFAEAAHRLHFEAVRFPPPPHVLPVPHTFCNLMCISYACLLPSCYIYISVFFILIIALISQYIHKKSSFSDRKSLKNILLILQDDHDHKIPVLHKELVLSVQLFYIIYDASGPQSMPGALRHRDTVNKYRGILHSIFRHQKKMS